MVWKYHTACVSDLDLIVYWRWESRTEGLAPVVLVRDQPRIQNRCSAFSGVATESQVSEPIALWLTLCWFLLTYLGLALGKLPWVRTDRAGLALVGAAGIHAKY
jgi:hypothetical protein